MKIQKIKKLSGNKYKIEFENGEKLNVYDDVILENGILYLKEIDKPTFDKMIKDNLYFGLYNKMVNKISVRLRSEAEIRKLLNSYGAIDTEIESIVKRLKSSGLINDNAFALAYVSDRIRLSKDGLDKIRKNLSDMNIENSIIEDAINSFDENILNDKLNNLVKKKIKLNKKYSNVMLKQKIVSELISLGFKREDISNAFDELSKEDTNVIDREYIRVYERLKKKYSGNELKRKFKETLFQKGFSMNDINRILEEKGL